MTAIPMHFNQDTQYFVDSQETVYEKEEKKFRQILRHSSWRWLDNNSCKFIYRKDDMAGGHTIEIVRPIGFQATSS